MAENCEVTIDRPEMPLRKFSLMLTNGRIHRFAAAYVHLDHNALLVVDKNGDLETAYAPGEWSLLQRESDA